MTFYNQDLIEAFFNKDYVYVYSVKMAQFFSGLTVHLVCVILFTSVFYHFGKFYIVYR